MMRKFIIAINLIAPVAAVASGSWPIGIGILFVGHVFLVIGILVPNCKWLGPVITSFEKDKKEVWLTIDDGPDPTDTPMILDLLDRNAASATFFLIGEKAAAHPELVAEILRRGHSIGNHTQTHPAFTFWRLGPVQTRYEIELCQATLGARPVLFRAPAGMRNLFVHPVLNALGLKLVGWTARGFDGRETNAAKVVARIQRHLRPGAIILVHESFPVTKHVFPELMKHLKKEGYTCILPH